MRQGGWWVVACGVWACGVWGCEEEGRAGREVGAVQEVAQPTSAPVSAPGEVGVSVPEAALERKAEAPGVVDALALHRDAVVVDMHVDALWFTHELGVRLDEAAPGRQSHEAQLARGGVDAVFFSVWVPPDAPGPGALALGLARRVGAELGPGWEVARSASDVRRIVGSGRRAALLPLEGGAALEGDPQAVDAFAELGVRSVSLTWNEANPFGGGAKARGGLTAKGRALVERLHRHGMLVDVSHANAATFWGLASVSLAPLVATHSNARAVCDHPRNLDDLQLLAIAESGGVVGLNLHSPFVVKRGRATLEDVGRHAAHLRAVMGAGHVGLGTDMEGNIQAPADAPDHALLPLLTRELLAVGFTPEELPGALGGNTLRALEEASSGELRRRVRCVPLEMRSKHGDVHDRFLKTGRRFAAGESLGVAARRPRDAASQLRIWGATPWEPDGVTRLRVRAAPSPARPEGWSADVTVPAAGAVVALPEGVNAVEIEVLEAGWLAEVSLDVCGGDTVSPR